MNRGWQSILFIAASAIVVLVFIFCKPDPPTQALILAPAAAILGLPHGAFDLPIARTMWPLQGLRGYLIFAGSYLCLAALVLCLWVLVPSIALASFVAYSGWHFSTDWEDQSLWWRVGGGLSTVGAPALLHGAEVERIFAILATPESAALVTGALGIAGAVGGMVCVATLTLTRVARPAAELAALWAAAWLLPPLLYFLAYFCFLHSPRHLLDARLAVRDQPGADMQAMAITLVTLVGAGFASFWVGEDITLDETILRIVFIGLAALTVPHMMLVEVWAGERTGRN